MAWRAVTAQPWALIQAQLPRRNRRTKGGRPPADDRQGFEGLLGILWTGAPWSARPERDGSKRTVPRRLTDWAAADGLLTMWRAFLDHLDDRQQGRGAEGFIDGMFSMATKGVRWSGRLQEAREQRSWSWPMARVLRSEYPWRRRPRRQGSGWSRRLRRGASAAEEPSAARPSGCLQLVVTPATKSARCWLSATWSQSCRRARPTEAPRLRTGASAGGTRTEG
jgi:transposase